MLNENQNRVKYIRINIYITTINRYITHMLLNADIHISVYNKTNGA